MLETTKLTQLPASKRVYYNNGKIYTYNDGIFSQSLLNGEKIEVFDFAKDVQTDIHTFRNDVLAFVESNIVRIEQLKKSTSLVNLPCMKKTEVKCIALSPSSLHSIIGNDDGTVNIIHNISASSILKFPLFNGDSTQYVDFLEENIIIGATKKQIILVDILEKGVLAKITTKGTILSIITSKNKIIYATKEKDIYLIDISDLSNISTTRIATMRCDIVDISFNIYNSAIFALCEDELFSIDFNSNIEKIDVEFENATNIAIISSSSLIIGLKDSSLIISNLISKGEEIQEEQIKNLPKNTTIKKDNIIRFLTVDDSATIRLVIKKSILNNFDDVEVYEANDGLEAMNFLKKMPNINVMLLDWNMPNMNGEEVVQAVSKIDGYKDIKIIMATTEGAKEKVKEMLSKGVKGYLVKPFRPNSVIPMIEKLIELIKSERESE